MCREMSWTETITIVQLRRDTGLIGAKFPTKSHIHDGMNYTVLLVTSNINGGKKKKSLVG